jgi:mevalonate kinase
MIGLLLFVVYGRPAIATALLDLRTLVLIHSTTNNNNNSTLHICMPDLPISIDISSISEQGQ